MWIKRQRKAIEEDFEHWYDFDYVKPISGQLCMIKQTDICEAYYTPNNTYEFIVVEEIDKGLITAWRPIYDFDTDM